MTKNDKILTIAFSVDAVSYIGTKEWVKNFKKAIGYKLINVELKYPTAKLHPEIVFQFIKEF